MKDKEEQWRDKERALIAERDHKKRQPDALDCEDCLGSDLNGVYERAYKPKGM